MGTDWDKSASAWINSIGADGDFARKHVLDQVMEKRIKGRGYLYALDVGCGEGRFCRTLRKNGLSVIGLDPTQALIKRALQLDFEGDYVRAVAEQIPFVDEHFELVVCYLSLIDITDFRTAIAEMVRVLRPGGTILVANLSGMRASAKKRGWLQHVKETIFGSEDKSYSVEHASWQNWDGIQVENWHRPLSAYMQAFLEAGLELRHFEEPLVPDPQTEREHQFNRAPWFVVMEWKKPDREGYVGRQLR
jgi:SAM-dependent methyltransferase